MCLYYICSFYDYSARYISVKMPPCRIPAKCHLDADRLPRLYRILNGRNTRNSTLTIKNSMTVSMNLLNLSKISPALMK